MQIIHGEDTEHGSPLIHIHFVERVVHGNGIGIKVYGEIKCINGARVNARELKLNTLEELQITPMGSDQAYGHGKYIVDKGAYDNYASVHVFDESNNPIDADSYPGPEEDGSIWLDFEGLGE